ncbi:MAG: holo-ACP synthase CitX [Anaerosolibacter sp.]|jgi:holo-ACP synthase|uniref:citrate lyase holo-[acyl-carrier protein] synthase n=1 Tax=Anaerosolibacter sp. TaxID=1872527 RepID=UPI00261ECBB5|nr:citrate lyase holo-[acyl-carrier protein] synthase [Anaerosolibacter sp.]MDF2548862.1 holo-ACP synthase CitX [Anaerosolibacter sp.]
MDAGIAITLEQMLDAREKRAKKQMSLIKEYKLPLVSFTVNIPGMYKNTPVSRKIFSAGCEALREKLDASGSLPVYFEQQQLDTGYEAYAIVDKDAVELKTNMLEIESTHPLGRLFDIDVIGLNGISITRVELGYPKRTCLICGQDAHACSRSRNHSVEELTIKINNIVAAYI